MPHQEHIIPWNKLDGIILDNKFNLNFIIKDFESLKYFSICMFNSIESFSNTSKEDESYNILTWEGNQNSLYGAGGHLGYVPSLTCGYIMLNLLLINRDKYIKIWNNNKNWVFNVCCGNYDGGHPLYFSNLFKELFDINGQLKEFDREITQLILNRCKDFFKCLYISFKSEKIISSNQIMNDICWLFNVNLPHD